MFIPLIFYYFNYFPDTHDGASGDNFVKKKYYRDVRGLNKVLLKREKKKLKEREFLRSQLKSLSKNKDTETKEILHEIFLPKDNDNTIINNLREKLLLIESQINTLRAQSHQNIINYRKWRDERDLEDILALVI